MKKGRKKKKKKKERKQKNKKKKKKDKEEEKGRMRYTMSEIPIFSSELFSFSPSSLPLSPFVSVHLFLSLFIFYVTDVTLSEYKRSTPQQFYQQRPRGTIS